MVFHRTVLLCRHNVRSILPMIWLVVLSVEVDRRSPKSGKQFFSNDHQCTPLFLSLQTSIGSKHQNRWFRWRFTRSTCDDFRHTWTNPIGWIFNSFKVNSSHTKLDKSRSIDLIELLPKLVEFSLLINLCFFFCSFFYLSWIHRKKRSIIHWKSR